MQGQLWRGEVWDKRLEFTSLFSREFRYGSAGSTVQCELIPGVQNQEPLSLSCQVEKRLPSFPRGHSRVMLGLLATQQPGLRDTEEDFLRYYPLGLYVDYCWHLVQRSREENSQMVQSKQAWLQGSRSETPPWWDAEGSVLICEMPGSTLQASCSNRAAGCLPNRIEFSSCCTVVVWAQGLVGRGGAKQVLFFVCLFVLFFIYLFFRSKVVAQNPVIS